SLESVRAFAVEFAERHAYLNVLINNAGVMACPLARTADGWESQFATNHIGHFLLTNLLAPLLAASAPSRVISVSSRGHRLSVWGATAPELEGKGGLYLDDCQIASVRTSPDDTTGYEAYALDPDAACRLWTVSEQHVGERFDY